MDKYEEIEEDIIWLADGYYSSCIDPVMDKIKRISFFHDQHEFLQAGDVVEGRNAERLAWTLIKEEFKELGEEDFYFTGNTNAIKEALDLIYVCCQYMNATVGPDKAKECWDALHANNMSKCVEGKLVKRADGKVEKPDGYEKLDLSTVLCNNT